MNGKDAHRAVVYLRISQDRTGDEAGVKRQREDCEQLCRERGWTLVAIEEDNDTEAKSGRKRRGFEALLSYIETGQADRVIAWTLDRLQRNKRDEVRLYDLCAQQGVRVSLVRGPELEWETPMGRWLADNLGSQARLEVEMKGDRHKRANQQRRARGHMGWTRRPFGYDRCPEGKIILVEEEAAGLREAAEIVLAGGTLAAGCRALDARGLTTTLGKPFAVTVLRRLLLSPRHAGRVTYEGADTGISGTWPVVFTEDEHQRLIDMLVDPRRRMAQSTEPRYLLSGVVECGRCGGVMRGSPMGGKGRRWHVYKCSTAGCYLARRSDLVDEVVRNFVIGALKMPDAASLLVPDANVNEYRAEATELRERREAIGDLMADGLLSAAKGRERLQRLTDQISEVERRIGRAIGDSPAASLVHAADPEAAWEALPILNQKAVVKHLFTVAVLPAGKGARFAPRQVRIQVRGRAETGAVPTSE